MGFFHWWAGGYDPLAAAFISASGITDATEKAAINTLASGLRSANLITKIPVLYPFVGGSSSTNRYNLMNPSTYLITYNGGWTFNSNGATSNGTNAYAQTGINMNAFASWNNNHLSGYSRTIPTAGIRYTFGASGDIATILSPINLITYYPPTITSFFTSGDGAYTNSGAPINSGRGLVIGTATGATQSVYSGTTLINSNANANNPITSNELYFGATNGGGTAVYFTDLNYALLTAGTYLDATDRTNLTSLVNAFQTTLGRNV
jgi:hypothetical protein